MSAHQGREAFPNITKVALEIAYDNGKINRDEPVEVFYEKLEDLFGQDGVDYADLKAMDDWIATLTEEQQNDLAAGEESDVIKIQQTAPDPVKVEGFFNDVFEL